MIAYILVRGDLLRSLKVVFFFAESLVFAIAAALPVSADTSGSISVEMTEIGKSIPAFLLLVLVVGALVFAGLVYLIVSKGKRSAGMDIPYENTEKQGRSTDISGRTILTEKQKSNGSLKKQVPINRELRMKEESLVKDEAYYRKAFKIVSGDIFDEKAEIQIRKENPEGNARIEEYLKEDERIIVNILKMRNGCCTQATLQVITNFSKAYLSRTLAELAERGIVFKERRGRKNMITLNA